MGDYGEVVEWLELVCTCANVICWLSLQSAPLFIKGTPQVVQVGALKPTTQPKQLARARARPHSKSERSPNHSIRDQSKAHANQSIRSARTKNVKSQKFHSKSHGYKCRMHKRTPNREESGVRTLSIPGFLNFAFYSRRAYSGVEHDVPTRPLA